MRIPDRLMRVIDQLNQLLSVPSADPDDARRRRLLNILLLCVAALLLIGFLTTVAGLTAPPADSDLYIISIPVVLTGILLTFLLNRYWSGRAAALLFLLLLTASVFAAGLEEATHGRSLIAFAIPIVMASVLLRPYTSFIIAGLASLLVNIVGMGVLSPPVGPNVSAVLIFFLIALMSWIVARSAERALRDLRAANLELDRRVSERTRDLQRRSIQLQTASEVARDATAILDVDQLLNATVRLISERFGFYHAGVFLMDERREYAVLHAASSESGRFMIERGHRQAVGKEGIVGHVAGSGEPLVVLDVGEEAAYLINPDLPNTRSEMALPLVSHGRIIGVLDVQCSDANVFDEQDVATLRTMADQLANAIETARSYREAERHVEELTALHNIDVAITSTLNLDEVLKIIYEQVGEVMGFSTFYIGLYDEERNELAMRLIVDQGQYAPPRTVQVQEDKTFTGWVMRNREPLWVADAERDELPVQGVTFGEPSRSLMILPLIVRDRVLGVISAQAAEPHAFSEDDRRLFLGIAHQAAIAIANARLFEETNRRLAETRLLQEVMQAAASTLDFDEVLTRTIETLHRTLGINYLAFVLPDEQGTGLQAHPSWIGYGGSVELEACIPMDRSVCGRVYRSGKPQIIADVREVPYYFGAVSEIRSEVAVPVKVADRVIAVLDAESPQLGAFGEDDLRLFSAIAAQLGVVLENTRLFEETNHRLAETRLLQEVMQAAASTLDFDEVLTRAVETLYKTLSVDYLTFVFPSEQETDLLIHPSWIGYDESVDIETGIPMNKSVCGRVYRSGEPQIIADVREVSYYFEITPETRSEIAVPVKVADRVIAVLDAESTQVGAFDEDDLHLFSAVAAQLGVVLENARLFAETKWRLSEANLIQEVMLAAASTLDFDLVLERTAKALCRALKIERLGFLLPDEEGAALVSHPSLVGYAEAVSPIPVEGTLVGQAMRTGQPVLVDDLTQSPAGSEYPSETRSVLAVPVQVGGRIVAVLHTESDRAGAFSEDELRLFVTTAGQLGVTLENARLYRRLETQATELSQAYNELQEIDRLRTQLVQNVSHELRTPLSLVKGYVELLAAGDLGRVLDSQQAALQVIRERIAILSRLINNLTALQAVPRQALVLVPLSAVEVVRGVLTEFRRSAEEVGIVFQEELPEGLPPIIGDRERLELVFGHLVDNAIKFSPEGGLIALRAWADRDMVYVSVADAGVGIPPEHLSRIFERFYQVNGSTRRRFGGMGIGLALVWEIVEAHGGTVSVESEPGKGSVFTVALPQAEGAEASEPS